MKCPSCDQPNIIIRSNEVCYCPGCNSRLGVMNGQIVDETDRMNEIRSTPQVGHEIKFDGSTRISEDLAEILMGIEYLPPGHVRCAMCKEATPSGDTVHMKLEIGEPKRRVMLFPNGGYRIFFAPDVVKGWFCLGCARKHTSAKSIPYTTDKPSPAAWDRTNEVERKYLSALARSYSLPDTSDIPEELLLWERNYFVRKK